MASAVPTLASMQVLVLYPGQLLLSERLYLGQLLLYVNVYVCLPALLSVPSELLPFSVQGEQERWTVPGMGRAPGPP